MSWSDDIRCLFCDGRLPLYRKITHGQFCSSAHRKAYWQEQERLAIERLHQTHDSLQAYRDLVPVDIASARKPDLEVPRLQAVASLLREPRDWFAPGKPEFQEVAEPAAPPASLAVPAAQPARPLTPPSADPPPAGFLEETPAPACYWTARASWEIEPAALSGAAPAMPPAAPPEAESASLALPPQPLIPLRLAPSAAEFLGAPRAARLQAVEAPRSAWAPVVGRAAFDAAPRPELPPANDPPFCERKEALKLSPVRDAVLDGSCAIDPCSGISCARSSAQGLLPRYAGAVDASEPQVNEVLAGDQGAALEAPLVERMYPLRPGPGVAGARTTRMPEAFPAIDFPQRACVPLGGVRLVTALTPAGLVPPGFAFIPASEWRPRGGVTSPAPSQAGARINVPVTPQTEAPPRLAMPMAGEVPCDLRPEPRPGWLSNTPGIEIRGAVEPAALTPAGMAAPVAIDCAGSGAVLTAQGANLDWAPPAAALVKLPLSGKQRAVNPPHTAAAPAPGALSTIYSLPQPPKVAPMLPQSGCEILDGKPVSDAFPVAQPGAAALPAAQAPAPPGALPATVWKQATGFWKNAPRDLRLLVFAVPALLALVFHPSVFPKVAVRAPQSNPLGNMIGAKLASVKQSLVDRAAVALDEDFRTGLDSWQSRGNYTAAWTFDATGFVQPGPLALYQPSMGLTDYQMQFLGMIDQKALSWVVRAADFENYYVLKLVVLKPGPLPEIGLTRYAVINGKAQERADTVVPISARSDMLYRVRLDITGDDYLLEVQGHVADSWSEHNLHRGGIGFFSARGEQSRVRWVQVTHQYDMLGRLCAYLAPYNIPNTGSW